MCIDSVKDGFWDFLCQSWRMHKDVMKCEAKYPPNTNYDMYDAKYNIELEVLVWGILAVLWEGGSSLISLKIEFFFWRQSHRVVKNNKAQQANDGSLSNEAIFHLSINYSYLSWM